MRRSDSVPMMFSQDCMLVDYPILRKTSIACELVPTVQILFFIITSKAIQVHFTVYPTSKRSQALKVYLNSYINIFLNRIQITLEENVFLLSGKLFPQTLENGLHCITQLFMHKHFCCLGQNDTYQGDRKRFCGVFRNETHTVLHFISFSGKTHKHYAHLTFILVCAQQVYLHGNLNLNLTAGSNKKWS